MELAWLAIAAIFGAATAWQRKHPPTDTPPGLGDLLVIFAFGLGFGALALLVLPWLLDHYPALWQAALCVLIPSGAGLLLWFGYPDFRAMFQRH